MEDNAAELYGSGRDLVALQMSDETTRFAPSLLSASERNRLALTSANARTRAAPEAGLSARSRLQEFQC
jgi:hypothetical protein